MQVIVRKGNRELTVPDEQAKAMREKGYDVLDGAGKVKEKATAGAMFSAAEYAQALAAKDKEIAALQAEIEKLKSEKSGLVEAIKTLKDKKKRGEAGA